MNYRSRWLCLLWFSLILSGMMVSCFHSPEPRWATEAETLISEKRPEAAIALLDSVDRSPSSPKGQKDRALMALMKVKSADKAYRVHTSDSLARAALEYYDEHRSSDRYPEALFYVGQVNADLGNSSESLYHMIKARDALGEGDPERELRLKALVNCNIADQMKRLYLYNDASKFYEEALTYDSLLNDTADMIYDVCELAFVYWRAGDTLREKDIIRRGKELCVNQVPDLVRKVKMEEMRNLLLKGECKAFLDYLPEYLKYATTPVERQYAMYMAADAYRVLGETDSVESITRRMTAMPGNDNSIRQQEKRLVMMSAADDTAGLYDAINLYVGDIRKRETRFRGAGSMADGMYTRMMSMYNEARSSEAERNSLRLNLWILAAIVAGVIAVCYMVMYSFARYRQHSMSVQMALLSYCLNRDRGMVGEDQVKFIGEHRPLLLEAYDMKKGVMDMVERLRRDDQGQSHAFHERFMLTNTGRKIRQLLDADKVIPERSVIWDEIHSEILNASPNFDVNLASLLKKVNGVDRRLAMLVKAGLSSKSICSLLGVSKGAVSSGRIRMCNKAFGFTIGNENFDVILRSL